MILSFGFPCSGSFKPDRNNFGPRVGVAYRLRDKWVVRGGYGLYYLGQNATGSNQGFSQRTNAIVSLDGLTPAVNLANAFAVQPGGQLLAAVGSSQGVASFLGQSLTVNWLDRPLPYSHQYSFDIQRELPGRILVETGYVGNQTRKLPASANANYVPVSELNRAGQSISITPNGFAVRGGHRPPLPALNLRQHASGARVLAPGKNDHRTRRSV